MSLSKPANILFDLIGNYFQALYLNPIRTKSLTSGVLASLANVISQRISNRKSFSQETLIAFALFGFIFGGSVPHYFFTILQKIVPHGSSHAVIKQLLIERFIYAPLYQAFSLYVLARFEGKSHNSAKSELLSLYWPVLRNNWKYLTFFQFINLSVMPQSLQVLYVNMIGFFWVIFLSYKRAKATERKGITKSEK
ncbi:peroxisomal membrane protein 2 [Lycorma delicatula]|uniref:peroxisomal membrane protein 2 n=1 Tax=Lycorma delicatula TaxID=130591 RepID=UPI003F51A71C